MPLVRQQKSLTSRSRSKKTNKNKIAEKENTEREDNIVDELSQLSNYEKSVKSSKESKGGHADEQESAIAEEDSLYKKLTEQYEALANLRETAVEKLFADYREKAELKQKKQQEIIKKQEEQIALLSTHSTEGLGLYKEMTGLEFKLEGNKYRCKQVGRNGFIEYFLNFDGVYTFTPVSHSEELTVPSFLEEEITFEADQLGLFFWRVLHYLTKQ